MYTLYFQLFLLGAIGSLYAICFGGKPFMNYIIDKYNQMWWSSCFGTNRLYWLKKEINVSICRLV